MHVNWPNTYTYNNNKKTSLEKIIKKKKQDRSYGQLSIATPW
jgi:hypothetical protein